MKVHKQFVVFTSIFILLTIIGTLTHELGHIAFAKALGFKTTLSYGSMTHNEKFLHDSINQLVMQKKQCIASAVTFEGQEKLDDLINYLSFSNFFVSIGGPFQTILTSIIGLLILYHRRLKIKANGFGIVDWIAVFMSLFTLRMVFNFLTSLMRSIIQHKPFFLGQSDELKIEKYLELPIGFLFTTFAILGFFIAIYIFFKRVPKEQRWIFLSAGIAGSFLGFYLWFYQIGPILMP